jgi:O-antigen ligase
MSFALPAPLQLAALLLAATIVSTVLLSGLLGGNEINFVVTAIFCALAVVSCMRRPDKVRIYPEVLLLIIWLAYAMIQSIPAVSLDDSIDRGAQVAQIIILAVLAINVMVWDGNMRLFAWAYVAAAVLSYLVSLFGFGLLVVDSSVVEQQNLGARASGTAGNANQFGTMMVQGQAAALFAGMYAKRYAEQILAGLAYLVLGIAAVNSGSRTALVGMFLLLVSLIWVFRIWRSRQLFRAVVLLVGLTVVGGAVFAVVSRNDTVAETAEAFLADDWVTTRYRNLFLLAASGGDLAETDASTEQSLDHRTALVSQAWEDSLDNAPFGLGLKNFSVIYGVYAHSNYFDILADTGFLGLLIFLGIYISLALRFLSAARGNLIQDPLPRLYIVSVLVIMIMDVSRVSYYNKQYWFFVFLVIGALEVFRRQYRRQQLELRAESIGSQVSHPDLESARRFRAT